MDEKLEKMLFQGNTIIVEGEGKMYVQYVGRKMATLIGRGHGKLENTKSIVTIEANLETMSVHEDGRVSIGIPLERVKVFNYNLKKKDYGILNEYLRRMGM